VPVLVAEFSQCFEFVTLQRNSVAANVAVINLRLVNLTFFPVLFIIVF